MRIKAFWLRTELWFLERFIALMERVPSPWDAEDD